MDAKTLPELLESNSRVAGEITHFLSENNVRRVSFKDLYARAMSILFRLQGFGARRGDTMILFIANSERFIECFWAAIMGGIIPVPVTVGINEHQRLKLLRIARQLGKPYLCAERSSIEGTAKFARSVGAGELFDSLCDSAVFPEEEIGLSDHGVPALSKPGDVAFIQFSSGATSEPKGVVLTHANLLANIRATSHVACLSPDDISLSWMPLTHDMGLIGFHLMMFANRGHSHFLPTERFVRRPLLWLELAHQIRATILCSPNFGYHHYLKVLAERSVDSLDLSSVRLIFNGAEFISAELCEKFLARLEPAKLSKQSMYPVYGLAEATLAVSFPPAQAALSTLCINRRRLHVGMPVELTDPSDNDCLRLVSEGRPVPACEVCIADDVDSPLAPGELGHVLIRGDNVTAGYYEDPIATRRAFTPTGWLRTGDLGFVHGGSLFISGRAKEVIVINGQNFYPSDLEMVVQTGAALQAGNIVAAGIRRQDSSTDRLVVFVVHRGHLREFHRRAALIAQVLSERVGLDVFAVVPVSRLPKTTSGKIMRHALVSRFSEGEFDAVVAELKQMRAAKAPPSDSPLDELEEKLVRYCESTLQGTQVSVHDNLFELGLNSMNLIQIHERISRDYPGRVDLVEMYNFPTIAELSRHVQGRPA